MSTKCLRFLSLTGTLHFIKNHYHTIGSGVRKMSDQDNGIRESVERNERVNVYR